MVLIMETISIQTLSLMTISKVCNPVSLCFVTHCDTQHVDTQYTNNQHNGTNYNVLKSVTMLSDLFATLTMQDNQLNDSKMCNPMSLCLATHCDTEHVDYQFMDNQHNGTNVLRLNVVAPTKLRAKNIYVIGPIYSFSCFEPS